MRKINFITSALLLCCLCSFSQQTPAKKQSESITITGATIHIGDGTIIDNGIVIFENGKIQAVADATTSKIALKGKIIDASGKHIYPGFIGANTNLGLVEVDAVNASNDQREMGSMIPHVRSLVAYNAESKVVESMRPNGILIAQVSPNGGRFSGTSSIMQLDAWNWQDAAIKKDDGIYLNWPNSFSRGRWWLGEPRGLKPNRNYSKQVNDIMTFVIESKAYLNGSRTNLNIPFEALEGLFDGSQKLYVNVNDEKGITDAVNFAIQNGIKMVVVGGYQAHTVSGLLKSNNIPVLIDHTHSLPATSDHDYDLPYKNPKLLADAGVLVGIHTGNNSNFQTRNLPFYAGQVVGQGMSKEDALKLITLNVAQILGVDTMLGSIEVGKSATLFVSKGDALDMRGNQLTHAFIDGREISLETHQTELWRRYSQKYQQD
ncbi:MAG: amidohydrolase family protein [Bacteroidetes bacterium]|jgi:imidazolonepropionase-like amidohydrolase|nr:amidohydrolase [Flavobacteriaceae bacterium]MCP4803189.1 amidohydrolase family protein [Bacteroidota bacterium]MDC3242622.1 amidohydrolase family protein [Flavobacteriaceae bacterium]|tara:strand:- start:2603 stop:3898 length:1296 start_codon:yes stop_codon:yes gene_type:complete